jgi:uncharacterized protein YyaL (SSP411 family)
MPNRLANESSPYLLQHAQNPVDWFPWSEEALNKAKAEDKPIFLSVGYSACHWCHVMEHESFENAAIAAFLNEHFVSIKVDREERPDLDQIYMQAVMSLQRGQGGWPLSAFLTPDCHVFFGGTYWPPSDSRGMPGFDRVLRSVLDAFQNRRDQVTEQSAKVTEYLNSSQHESSADRDHRLFDEALLFEAGESLERIFDFTDGGFGSAPKFPHTMDLQLLMRLDRRESLQPKNESAADPSDKRSRWLAMVCLNLQKMALGGIYDHLAGGFARYSVDAKWLVPHFEKMLYDNGLLMDTFLDAFTITGDSLFEQTVRETFDYQLKYMTDDDGGFHSTEDADSEGVEGKFYVWTPAEIVEILGDEDGKLFCEVYDVTENGNFEGENILNLQQRLEATAKQKEIDATEFCDRMKRCRGKLLEVRDKRIRPGKDDKILVSWNSLMINAMARGGRILSEPKYLDAAINAANFLLEKMVDDQAGLLHTFRNGKAKLAAYLDDYSYFINALITLYETDGSEIWLEKAIEYSALVIENFHDEEAGAFFFTSENAEKLIARHKEFQDSSVPSGNSMMAMALLRLAQFSDDSKLIEIARETANQAYDLILRAPSAAGQMLCSIDRLIANQRQIVIAADKSDRTTLLELIYKKYEPNQTICFLPDSEPSTTVLANSLIAHKSMIDQKPTVYVCENFACEAPLVGMEQIKLAFE